jgi:hypothetical protein
MSRIVYDMDGNVIGEEPDDEDGSGSEQSSSSEQSSEPSSDSSSDSSGSDSQVPASQDAGGANTEQDATKKQKKIEFKNLEGDVDLIPTKRCFKILNGDTVKILNVGKYLSGLYYVKGKSVSLSESGTTVKLKVIKTKFGDNIKGSDQSGS